jgi:hypothetical protein
MNKLVAQAQVTITLRINTLATWNPNVSMDLIHKQAVDEVLGTLRMVRILDGRAQQVGKPEVSAVIVNRIAA